MPSAKRLEIQPFLDRLSKRSLLSQDEEEAILNLPGKVDHVQAGRDFVPLGKRTDHASLILNGLVGRFGQNKDGGRQITAIHIPGDMPDLASVVQSASGSPLQALSIASILRVPHSALRNATSRYPAIAEAMWRDCMVDANILAQWVVNVGRRDAKTRMAHLFCEMAVRLRAAPAKGELMFPFAITQTQLGDATGLTSVHVNRTLKSLREAGLAEVSSRAVRVPNLDALAEAGEFDATYLQEDVKPDDRPRIADGYLTST